jgi:Mn2+/Fe2+ NRAMP family transporter
MNQVIPKHAISRSAMRARLWRGVFICGPGLLVMLADTDAGNVVAAAQSGAQSGYRLLPLLFALIPLLFMVQELTVRLGIYTQRGHAELIRERFGVTWAYLSVVGLIIATVGTLVTEFTAVAGVGELYGLSKFVTLPIAAVALMGIVMTGSYRRVERIAVMIGLCELAFVIVAWRSHPDPTVLMRDLADMRWTSHDFLFLVAALIGAVFNPWMIFYQQSAVVEKKLEPRDYALSRWETGAGAALTQCLTACVLIAAAAALGRHTTTLSLTSVGDISAALTPCLGIAAGRLIFSVGVLGAAIVAAVVSSLAMAWGVGEVLGLRRSLEFKPRQVRWFYITYIGCVAGSAVLVGCVRNLVWLNLGAQVVNALMLPFVFGSLLALAVSALPENRRLRGTAFWLLLFGATATALLGLYGGLSPVI